MNQTKIDLKPTEILVVDDIPDNLNVLCQALESEGYKIIAAPSGEVALQIAALTQPDLILLDIMMPGIDGFETCLRLKANPVTAEIPVIFITAHNETKRMVEGFSVGGVDYITKPFQHEEVCVRVQNHLTIKSLRDGLHDANTQLENALKQLEADNARKTEELEQARMIQEGFLPIDVPRLPHLEIATFQKPATEVGGDYYDFFPQEDGRFLLAIGDATGHGVGASLMVSAAKMALRTVDEPSLTLKMSQINTHLKWINSYNRLNMALTLVELTYDKDSRAVLAKAAGGGMPPLYILGSDGDVEEISIEGMPLGAVEGVEYTQTAFQLEKSEVLIFMSDGLPERLDDNDEIFGYARLVAEIKKVGKTRKSASGILDTLVKLGDDWSNNTPQYDDITLVVLKLK